MKKVNDETTQKIKNWLTIYENENEGYVDEKIDRVDIINSAKDIFDEIIKSR